MINTILNIKSEELKDSLKSLNINSNANITFTKYVSFFFIALFLLVYFFYPIQLLGLFHLLNLNILSLTIHPLNIILLFTLISGNKNMIATLKNDFYTFYGDKNVYLFSFFYIKDKFYVLISMILFEVIFIHSVLVSLLSVKSLVISVFLFCIGLIVNVFYVHISVFKEVPHILEEVKFFISIAIMGVLLLFISEDWLHLGVIPNYVIVNIPFLYLIANLFIYSELIILAPNYKQLFFMHKYLKTPFFKYYNKSVLYSKTMPLFSVMVILITLFLFKEQFDAMTVLSYVLIALIGYVCLLYLTYKTVMYEAYISQKNYFLYFVIMETFFLFVLLNLFVIR